ncbi:MAG: hypothetical protein MJ152_04795, partial [Clostridia bacterium]|nr:hypothetical protein [Clostridia bacterium]
LEYLQLRYFVEISDIDENDQNVSSPVNVGRYEVVIGLKEATAASFAWLKEITLSYKIYLDIQPARLHLDYTAMSRSFEKVYDGTTLYSDVSAFVNSLRLRDNARLNIAYTNQPEGANFIFMQGIVATITYTDNRGIQQATNKANEGSSIKYNITLSKIKLDSSSVFNRNFVL